MKRDPQTIVSTLWRCLKLRCPVCDRASIVERPFNLKHVCSACGVIFKREEGFFVGAIMANVVATEAFILLAYFVCLLFPNLSERAMLGILFAIGVSFPLAFYHHAWAFWLGLDHLIEGLSREPSRP
ncbi:MAG TPA: hypothetical protein VFU37_16035 [Pyrinomonadaceae bacterium]|nr:hypothetical protein [Pyrinomonadaceae bacterium]